MIETSCNDFICSANIHFESEWDTFLAKESFNSNMIPVAELSMRPNDLRVKEIFEYDLNHILSHLGMEYHVTMKIYS